MMPCTGQPCTVIRYFIPLDQKVELWPGMGPPVSYDNIWKYLQDQQPELYNYFKIDERVQLPTSNKTVKCRYFDYIATCCEDHKCSIVDLSKPDKPPEAIRQKITILFDVDVSSSPKPNKIIIDGSFYVWYFQGRCTPGTSEPPHGKITLE